MSMARAFSIIMRGAVLAAGAMMMVASVALAQTPQVDLAAQYPVAPDRTPEAPSAVKPAPIGESIDPHVRDTLARYGTFQTIAIFGEVWKPTIVPSDWRPYAACHWVNSRGFGWFYDDQTPWGAIIHHFGRWTHVVALGWVWVPGSAFSPGWVAWRASPDYIGWAPLPPDGNLKAVDAVAFDSGGFWTFMETPVFDRGCGEAIAIPGGREAELWMQTQPVTALAFAGGVWVAVLPDYVVGPLVDIVVSFKPWSNKDLISILSKLNVSWNSIDVKTTVNSLDCEKHPPRRPRDIPPPRPIACAGGSYMQPDGRCVLPVIIPPSPTCVEGSRLGDRGLCGAQQAYSPPPVMIRPTTPPPPNPPPISPPPNVVVPSIVPLPRPVITVASCQKPGFRIVDGRCRRPRPPLGASLNPPPPAVVVPVTPGPVEPVRACRKPGFVRQPDGRCRRPGAPVATVPFVPPHVSKPPRPADLRRPVPASVRPARIKPSRPAVTPALSAKPVFRPPSSAVRRPVVHRPSVQRPSVQRPARRPALRPSRPVFHARPVIRSASRRSAAPRRGGGRRRR